MANYSLTVGSNFEPFSFERFIQPLQMYGEAYREIEDNLSALETAAGEWEQKANEQSDPIAHAQYLKYAEDLRKQADNLSKYGLNPSTRRKMLNMRRRYSSEIVPIAEAWTRRQQLADEQRAAWLQDPSIRFSTDFKTASLDTLLSDPNASYDPLSGKWIENEAATLVSNLAKTALQDPKYSKVMDNQYWEIRQQTGYTREEIDDAFNGKGPKELRMMIDDIHNSIKSTGNRAYDKDFVNSSIRKGFYAGGIGGTSISHASNGEYISAKDRMNDATQRYGINVSAATQRRGQDIGLQETKINAATTRRGQDISLKESKMNNATTRRGQDIQLKIAKMSHSGGSALGGVSKAQLDAADAGTLSKNSIAYLGDGNYLQIDMTKKDGFFEPFAFDTSGDHGKGFSTKSYTSPENKMSDFSTPGGNFTSKRSYNYIEDANTKKQIRGYVRKTFGQQLPDGVIDQIASNLVYYQDWNAFQNNRWMVTLPGTDADGSVKNPTQVQKFFSNATSIIRGWESTKNKSTK